jgi:ATPase MipZ
MSVEPNTRGATSAHVVVLGNEKGGAGKSTVAMHVAVALMNVGQRVATIDVDSRQRTFTRYMENRRAWARKTGRELKVPTHFCVACGSTLRLDENEAIEFAGFAETVGAVERSHDFVVVDKAGTDNYLTRLAHSMADTLLGSRNKRLVGEGLAELSARLGFRCVDGFAERLVYREFFPRGLTALDNLDQVMLGRVQALPTSLREPR